MASDVWADMLGEFSSTGASLLALQCIGFRTICTTENAGPVHNMSELAGKTIRITEGPIFLDDYNAWGAAPVSMSASEIMPALQNGTIDGVDHVPVTLYTGNGQGEYIKYVAVTNQAAHFNGLDINNKFYEGLPADLQALIQKAASEAAEFRTQALQADNETYVQKLTDEYGITFYYPTEEEIAQLQEAVQPVYENFVSTHEFDTAAAALAKYFRGGKIGRRSTSKLFLKSCYSVRKRRRWQSTTILSSLNFPIGTLWLMLRLKSWKRL